MAMWKVRFTRAPGGERIRFFSGRSPAETFYRSLWRDSYILDQSISEVDFECTILSVESARAYVRKAGKTDLAIFFRIRGQARTFHLFGPSRKLKSIREFQRLLEKSYGLRLVPEPKDREWKALLEFHAKKRRKP